MGSLEGGTYVPVAKAPYTLFYRINDGDKESPGSAHLNPASLQRRAGFCPPRSVE